MSHLIPINRTKISKTLNSPLFRAVIVLALALGAFTLLLGCGSEETTRPSSDSMVHAQLDWTPPVPQANIDKAPICNISGPKLATFIVEGDTVHVISCYFDQNSGSIKAFVSWPEDQICRTIELYRDTYATDYNGFAATSSFGTSLKFGLAFSWILDEQTGTTSEWTNTDYLEISVSPDGDGFATEVYDANGVTDSFGFEFDNPANNYDKASTFQAFYTANVAGTTLDNNPEGDRLAELIAHELFLDWMFDYFGYTETEINRWDWKKGIINIGGTLKCAIGGGVANPACHVYIGYVLAFGIADVLCDLWVDCGE